MELLYIWINQSENGRIRQKGFNFSPLYSFEVEIDRDRYCVRNDASWQGKPSVFKTDVISNVTAVVGKNGSGKTTLMDYLYHNQGTPVTDVAEPGYERYNTHQRELSYCIMIYQGDVSPVIYHNIKDKEIVSSDAYPVYDLNNREVYANVNKNPGSYTDVLKIYLSNSQYCVKNFGGMGSMGLERRVALIPDNLHYLSDHYYRKVFGIDVLPMEMTRSYLWNRSVYAGKKSEDFQALCDILYFNKLHETGRENTYFSVIGSTVNIIPIHPVQLLERAYPSFLGADPEKRISDENMPLLRLYRFFERIAALDDMAANGFRSFLYLYLIVEYTAQTGTVFPYEIGDYHSVENWISEHGEELARDEYFSEALAEIEELNELVADHETRNLVPETDLAFKRENVFDKSDAKYYRVLSYISRLFNKEKSFVLRYLLIELPQMSSGERAFQNLFSWLNLLEVFHQIDDSIIRDIPHDILLLIDEIDLYLHPEWQQKFVKNLLDELEDQFSDHRIQIIFATHSPLCLSDIPTENSVYLGDDQDGLLMLYNRSNVKQTFGCDIYTLLDSAFFLKDFAMGLYSRSFIQRIIDKINSEDALSEADVDRLREDIDYIGNPVIAAKLRQMMDNKTKSNLILRKRYLEAELADVRRKIEE